MSGANTEIARRAYEAFNRGGVDAILEFLDPEIEWRMGEQFARRDRVYRGHAGVREVLAIFEENLDGFRADPHEFIEAGDAVVVPVRLHGNEKGSGIPRSYELVQVWMTRDGRTAHRLEVYGDVSEALAAVDPSKPARPSGDSGDP